MEQRSQRFVGASDRASLQSPNLDIQGDNHLPPELIKYFSDNVYLNNPWHHSEYFKIPKEDTSSRSSWRNKERMKTVAVALVLCLNIGTDPPESSRPIVCARKEAWVDPVPSAKKKSLETIGNSLQKQYEKWQSKAKFKQCLDPTPEDLHRLCVNMRKSSKSDRVLFHYNGHGTPRPTKNGELWVYGKNYTHYMPVPVFELKSWLGEPVIYVLDCSGAGALLPYFNESHKAKPADSFLDGFSRSFSQNQFQSVAGAPGLLQPQSDGSLIVLASCRSTESLPVSPQYPADIFTACLTTPIHMALKWFFIQNPLVVADFPADMVDNIPGAEGDRKTPRGELNWIFTAITDTIAWNTLPSTTFQKLFRQDLMVASLFRNFLLSKRIMKSVNCTPQSIPSIPDCTTHPLWQSWDIACEMCLMHVWSLSKGSMMVDPLNNMPLSAGSGVTGGSTSVSTTIATATTSVASTTTTNSSSSSNNNSNSSQDQYVYRSSFFTDHLTAFEIWLDFEAGSGDAPALLPIVLQVLLSQTHRLRALLLLKRYLSLGQHAVHLALLVGIYPYILKLLHNPANEIKEVLVCIWASIIGFDNSCRVDLVKDKLPQVFISYLAITRPTSATFSTSLTPTLVSAGPANVVHVNYRCLAAFVLAEICNGHQEGRAICLQQGLHRSCSQSLTCADVLACADLKKWICLCLFKLCEDFAWAKYLCITETGHPQLYPLLNDADTSVRAASVLALGELFGSSLMNPPITHQLSNQSPPRSGNNSNNNLHAQAMLANRSNSSNNLTSPMYPDLHQAYLTEQIKRLLETELLLAIQLLDSCTDGSVMVRKEAVTALGKFVLIPVHIEAIKIVVSELRNFVRLAESIPLPTKSYPNQTTAPISISGVSGSGTMSSSHTMSSMQSLPNMNSAAAKELSIGISADELNNPNSRPTNLVLSQIQVESILMKLEEYLDKMGFSQKDRNASGGSISPAIMHINELSHSSDPDRKLCAEMARNYLRLWLALQEVSGKDPHAEVAITVNAIIEKLNCEVEKDEQLMLQTCTDANEVSETSNSAPSSARYGEFEFGEWATASSSIPIGGGLGGGMGAGKGGSTNNIPPLMLPSQQPPSYQANGNKAATPMYSMGAGMLSPQSCGFPSFGMNDMARIEPSNSQLQLASLGLEPSAPSYFYAWNRLLFLCPDIGFDPYEDPLAADSQFRQFRSQRLNQMIQSHRDLSQIFRDIDEKLEQVDRATKARDDRSRVGLVASLPASVSKFEEKNLISLDNTSSTSQLLFHPFQDIIAVTDGYNVGIWSTETGTRIVNINCTEGEGRRPTNNTNTTLPGAAKSAFSRNSMSIPATKPTVQQISSAAFCPSVSGKVTSMQWINESYESLLLLGSDDGSVRVYKDDGDNEFSFNPTTTGNYVQSSHNNTNGHRSAVASNTNGMAASNSSIGTSDGISLATAFTGLPDIDDITAGSGMVTSWLQNTGSLSVAGNSKTVRIWDLGKEQCSRIFHTGHDTCVTVLNARTISADLNLNYPLSVQAAKEYIASEDRWSSSLTFTGFADGSIALFDQRVAASGGRVHFALREHDSWIISAYCRADVPEIITASVQGTVKFSDLRSMRSYKKLVVQKSLMTTVAVHSCAPIIATGSQQQFIKLLTFGGDQLGKVLKYHSGFVGQRIGPVTCLAFHPSKLLLAAGATDNIVSLYCTQQDT